MNCLQENLEEFRQYSKVTKPPKAEERARLEAHFHTLQTKLRVSGRPAYVPSEGKLVTVSLPHLTPPSPHPTLTSPHLTPPRPTSPHLTSPHPPHPSPHPSLTPPLTSPHPTSPCPLDLKCIIWLFWNSQPFCLLIT